MDAMRPSEQPLAPGAQQVAAVVEHRDRMVAAVEAVDIVLAVDADRGAIAEHALVRGLRPGVVALEAPRAAAARHRHRLPPSLPLARIIRLLGGAGEPARGRP